MPKFEHYAKYEVFKLDDIDKYLSPAQKELLQGIIETIHDGRVWDGKPPCNNYVVVNEDEPYTKKVWELIQKQWEKDNA